MKKYTTKITVFLMVAIMGVVGCFAYLSRKSRSASDEAVMTAAELLLSRDLQTNYPPTVKEVAKYYADLQKCIYSESCTDEDLERLGRKARELYDADLLAANDETANLLQLKVEVDSARKDKRWITAASVASSANVDTFQEDGYEFARIHCVYTVLDGGKSTLVDTVYLLRRDEGRRWKIYGWDLAQNVHPTG